ncbi:hypothetical protein CMI48_03015 [Candidatus Pacearchaeota archaeon]|nr:hypothetical protein [Candidatus Pacearchaeota archaeon]|tara:strand:- start:153 stop:1076 length:924 start_codon:yes stop_codon:yes gene_type:complete
MKRETIKGIEERIEQLRGDIPYLEKAVKKRDPKGIERSSHFLIYLLHKIAKNAVQMGTGDAISVMNDFIYKQKLRKMQEERKYVNVKKQYSIWSKGYDATNNVAIYLEEKHSGKFIGGVKGKRVLDFGCGTGRYSVPLAKKGAGVTAIDFTQGMLNEAKKKAKKEKVEIDFSLQDITKYESLQTFDLIISMLVLDHIKSLRKIVRVMKKASHVGTEVVISNIHPSWILKNFSKSGKEQGYLVEGYVTDQFYHPLEEYVSLFGGAGFILSDVKEVIYENQYQNFKRFEGSRIFKDRPVLLMMKFRRVE